MVGWVRLRTRHSDAGIADGPVLQESTKMNRL